MIANRKLSEEFGFGQGFDRFDVGGRTRENFELLPLARRLLGREAWDDARSATDAALDWLEGNRHRPFFLWVHYLDPHWPYEPPQATRGRFARPGAGKAFEARARDLREGRITLGELFFETRLAPEEMAHALDLYDEEIVFVDGEIGRLLGRLRAWGLEENTLVVFTSDHGESFGEHGLSFTHTFTLYEELTAVPLVFRWPGKLPAGRREDRPARLVDVLPTTLALAGHRGSGFDGVDLFATHEPGAEDGITFGEAATISPAFPEHRRIHLPGIAGMWRMVRRPPWKLLLVPRLPEPEVELYDLVADPREATDLSRERPEIAAALKEVLGRFLARSAREGAEEETASDPAMRDTLRALGYVR